MSTMTPRQLLAEADRQRRTAEAAESIRRNFRLGSKPAMNRRGLFARRNSTTNEWQALTDAESMALYDAAAIVKREATERADRLEARVTANQEADR